MARYPPPLNEQQWDYLMNELNKPLTEEYKRSFNLMAKNGRKLKVHV
jgi:hypothetical protein